jgi:4'-phosphopantetheinyl transferase EntD
MTGPAAPPALADLAALYPPGVAVCVAASDTALDALLPEELTGTARFVPARLADYRRGRHCARRALAALGLSAGAIPFGRSREPVWPTGVVGSITHAGGVAAAAVARASDWRGLGLDLEDDAPLDAELVERICTPRETASFAASGLAGALAAKLSFCCKEAAYKALWPVLRRFLDFHQLEICWQADRRFTVVAQGEGCPPELATALDGRWCPSGRWLAAAAWLAARSA